jgi:enamine deaminase RidA (YjgF/YER057c/UK114 family)
MSDDFTLDFAGQAQRAFAALDNGLAQVGTDKRRLISVQVFLEDAAAQKKEFDDMWTDWIGMNTEHWPMRSCVQVTFTGGNRIELLAVAVRDEPVMETDDSA